MPSAPEATLDPRAGDWWEIVPRQHGVIDRARELWRYRYLWWYFASDTIMATFRRSKLGWIWLLLRVTAPVGLNAIIFGGVLGVDSGSTPYFLFFLCGTTTWVLFERSLLFDCSSASHRLNTQADANNSMAARAKRSCTYWRSKISSR